MRKRFAALLVLVFIVAMIAGCSKTDPLEVYKQAGVKASEAKTSRQIATVSSSVGGLDMSVVTDMTVDTANGVAAGTCSLTVPGAADELEFAAYLANGTMYMQMPGMDKYIVYPTDSGDLYKSIDPNQITELVAAGAKPVLKDATFTVNGNEINGQKVTLTIDTAKLKAAQTAKYEAASAEVKQLMADSLAAFDSMGPTIPLAGYINGDGYLARIELDLTVTQDGTEVAVQTVVEMFDFGKAVDVQVPTFTAENTLSFEQLMQGLGSIPR